MVFLGSYIELFKYRAQIKERSYQHPDLPFKTPQIPSNRDQKPLHRGTWQGPEAQAEASLAPAEVDDIS